MDAYELTHLLPKPEGTIARLRRERREAEVRALAADAEHLVRRLPLGTSLGPAVVHDRLAGDEAHVALDGALRRTAVAHGVCIGPNDTAAAIARRLARARVVAPPLADAVVLLEPALQAGGASSVARTVERLVGYLDHRAGVDRRRWFRAKLGAC